MPLDARIEAILFFKGEPVSLARLASILETSEEEVKAGLDALESALGADGRGLVLLRKDGEVELGTKPELSALIERLTKEELSRDLGKAGLETLSIVLYRAPISRREIDYIRGVNSTFILRNLLIRGLVEKIPSPTDQRSFLYRPTFELLRFMGLSKAEDLPEYASMRQEVERFEAAAKEPEEAEAEAETPAPEPSPSAETAAKPPEETA